MNILQEHYNKTLEIDNYQPSENEKEKIIATIDSFSDEDLMPTIDVFRDYYSIKVPDSIIRELFKKDFTLAYENISKGIYDTYARDLLMGSLLQHIQMNCHWPFISSSDDYTENFFKNFKQKCKDFDIVTI